MSPAKEGRPRGEALQQERFHEPTRLGKGCEMSSRQVKFVFNLCRDDEARRPEQLRPNSSILNRLGKLPPADQNLLNLALSRKHTFRQIAALVGSNPGSVCRR